MARKSRNEFREVLNKLAKKNRKKFLYFCFINKIDNITIKYSQVSREEFMTRWKFSEISMEIFRQWEGSDEYQNLYRLLMEIRSNKDLYDIYNVVREKALSGDDKAVKTFLVLRKELKNKPINIVEDKEEGQQEEDLLDITE